LKHTTTEQRKQAKHNAGSPVHNVLSQFKDPHEVDIPSTQYNKNERNEKTKKKLAGSNQISNKDKKKKNKKQKRVEGAQHRSIWGTWIGFYFKSDPSRIFRI